MKALRNNGQLVCPTKRFDTLDRCQCVFPLHIQDHCLIRHSQLHQCSLHGYGFVVVLSIVGATEYQELNLAMLIERGGSFYSFIKKRIGGSIDMCRASTQHKPINLGTYLLDFAINTFLCVNNNLKITSND